MNRNPKCYKYLDEEFKSDRNCFIIAARKDISIVKIGPAQFKNDRFISFLIRKKSDFAEFNSELTNNVDYMSEVIQENGSMLEFASP